MKRTVKDYLIDILSECEYLLVWWSYLKAEKLKIDKNINWSTINDKQRSGNVLFIFLRRKFVIFI